MVPLHLVPAGFKRTLPVFGKILTFNKFQDIGISGKKERVRNLPVHYDQKQSHNIQPFRGWCMPEQPEGYIKPAKHNLL
jgi:hypothetical protein